MTDSSEDERETTKKNEDTSLIHEVTVSTVSSVASSLAGMFLEEKARKGREIEIPSLGIIIGKANLREQIGSRNNDNVKDKERSPKQT